MADSMRKVQVGDQVFVTEGSFYGPKSQRLTTVTWVREDGHHIEETEGKSFQIPDVVVYKTVERIEAETPADAAPEKVHVAITEGDRTLAQADFPAVSTRMHPWISRWLTHRTTITYPDGTVKTRGAAKPAVPGDEATCANCDQKIFVRPEGHWDLVYRLQSRTTVCFHDHGVQNDDAYYAHRVHVPA